MVLQSGLLYSCLANTSGVFATQLAGGNWKLSRMCGPWERDVGYYVGDIVDAAAVLALLHFRPNQVQHSSALGAVMRPIGAIDDNSGTLRMFSSASVFSSDDVGASFRIDVGSTKRTLFRGRHEICELDLLQRASVSLQGDIQST